MIVFFRKTHERILRKFLFHGVEFVLIGGHASIFHGVERTPNNFSFGMIPNVVDVLNYSVGISIDEIFNNAIYVKIDDLRLKVIDIRDLLANKMAINRHGVKSLVDQQDILVLKKIIGWKPDKSNS